MGPANVYSSDSCFNTSSNTDPYVVVNIYGSLSDDICFNHEVGDYLKATHDETQTSEE